MEFNVIAQGGVQTNFDEGSKSQGNTETYEVLVEKTTNIKADNEQKPKEEDIKKALECLNKTLEKSGTYAEYEVHKYFGDIMIKIRDSKTKEVLQEVPPKKILDMMESLCKQAGIMVDKRA